MDKNKSKKCVICIGAVNFVLECATAEYAASLREYFEAEEEGRSEFTLELEVEACESRDEIPTSLFTTKVVEGTRFRIGENLVSGFFDAARRSGKLKVNYIITSDIRTRVFEQLLYQAYYSACRLADYNSVLLHSCSVIKEDGGYVFVGESGSGKSTIAELSRKYKVLNDEISMLHISGEEITLHSTPFNGYFKNKEKGAAPLRGIFFLKHGQAHKLTPLKHTKALRLLFQQIVPPIGLEEVLTGTTQSFMLDSTTHISARVPVYQLEFLPDAGFWDEITGLAELKR